MWLATDCSRFEEDGRHPLSGKASINIYLVGKSGEMANTPHHSVISSLVVTHEMV